MQNGPPKENNKIIFINFGGRKEKNYFFVCIFNISPYFFRSGELVGCRIKFCIQRVPTRYTFDRPHYPKNTKYLKKCDDDSFQEFLIFGVAGSIKSMPSGYSLDAEFNFGSNELSRSKFE